MIVTAHTDGGCRRKRNVAGYAAVIESDNNGDLLTISEATDYLTNNVAEYKGLLLALNYAVENKARLLVVYMDSELVVRQIQGVYAVKDPKMMVLRDEAQGLIRKIPRFSIHHVYRDMNKQADAAVNAAMDRRLERGR